MAISFVDKSSGSGAVTGGLTFTVTKPAGTADGDVGFIFASATDAINGFSSPGWTQKFNVSETGGDSGMWVAWKAFSGEGASWAVTSTGTESYAYICVVFRGVHNTVPIGASDCTSKTTATAQVCGPITVTDTGAWFVCSAESDQAAGGAVYSGPGGAFVFDATIGDATSGQSQGVGHENLSGATGSTSRTLTCAVTDVYVACALEVLPAAGAAAVIPDVTHALYG